LPQDAFKACHAVQTSSGQFIVLHDTVDWFTSAGEKCYRKLCLLDTDGHVLRSFGGSGSEHVSPDYLAVDANGFVYVADL